MAKKKKKSAPPVKYPAATPENNPLDGLMLREDAPDSSLDCGGTTPLSPARHVSPAQSADVSAHSKISPSPQSAIRNPHLIFSSPGIWLYQDNCLAVLDAVAAKHPEGRFDMIFADPPYFLSNGGITCHAGKMVSVHKGDWDVSRGPEWNHEFNTEWLRRCQRVLKPNGTIWVSGTHHVIFSVGFAMQQLGFKILNDIAWEKPNPPPNLSCRYFTHSTETILWAAKNEKSKHTFNYAAMRAVTGKQMKTVWRKEEFSGLDCGGTTPLSDGETCLPVQSADMSAHSKTPPSPKSALSPIWTMTAPGSDEKQHGKHSTQKPVAASPSPGGEGRGEGEQSLTDPALSPIWTMTAPGSDEKIHGKHPTQKPVSLIERCLLASTNPGDLVLDPFLGGGTTAIACIRTKRQCVGIELDEAHARYAAKRVEVELETREGELFK